MGSTERVQRALEMLLEQGQRDPATTAAHFDPFTVNSWMERRSISTGS